MTLYMENGSVPYEFRLYHYSRIRNQVMQNDEALVKIKFPQFQGRHIFLFKRELVLISDLILMSGHVLLVVFLISFSKAV